jgi:penicillin amidase
LNRLLKYINLALALLCAAAATLVWWYGYRVLPRTSGRVAAPVSARVAVGRDQRGVPHIRAASVDDALFAQGYAAAQDRLFQMEVLRRQEAGTLAELFGPVALESDLLVRRMRLRRVAEHNVRALPPQDRRALSAYARGVNFFLETHLGAYPVEFTLLGADPAPWSLSDSLLVALAMYRSLTQSWRDELVKKATLDSGDPALASALFPTLAGLDPQPGSNAWVLAGSRTRSGKPLLANDPHLRHSLPCIWYQVTLEAPGLHAAGVSLPGLPGVIIGHNRRIAWGMTNVGFDVQDLFEVRLDLARALYLDGGKPAVARQEQESVRVRGGATVSQVVWSTRLGPVVLSEAGRHYALHWSATEAGPLEFPILDINRAGNWSEFTAALRRFQGPAQNFVYADVDGNIGYHAAGRLPIRKTHAGDVPVPASETSPGWHGFIPFDELPLTFNPPSGIIVTANQNPFPPDYPYRVSGDFAPVDRARQIRALLHARPKWSAAEMLAVQKDVYSSFHHFLARSLVAASRGSAVSHPLLDAAVPLLDAWNGQMEIGEPAPFLAALAAQHLRKAIVERASPGKAAAYAPAVPTAVVEQLLRARSPGWFPDWDQLLRRVLLDAAEEGARMQGRDPARWDYGRFNTWVLSNPVLGAASFVGGYFQIGPAPMSGAATTVKQVTRGLGPSMRFVADLAAWDHSCMNLTTGQSGQPLSSHYTDQWRAYYTGDSFPLAFDRVDIEDTLELVPASRP